MVGITCGCGRDFKSPESLAQHQADKIRILGEGASSCRSSVVINTSQKTPKRPSNPASREAWMWGNVQSRKAIHIISHSTLQPTTHCVSSISGSQLVCSYSWQNCKDPIINIPGTAPRWRGLTLPVDLPPDKGTYFIDENASRVPHHRFEPLFRATAAMTPGFRFDTVDIVSNRNSLRKLLDYAAGRALDSFRINLLLVNDTLFIERCERSFRELIRGSRASGWGHSFENAATSFPPEVQGTTGYHRTLCYSLGDLQCVVQFEVDSFYEPEPKEDTGDVLALAMGNLSLKKPSTSQITEDCSYIPVMPQYTAAEIKSTVKPKSPSSYMPQLWFGRTPWLIVGTHTNGRFYDTKITNVGLRFQDWETQHQAELQKMVSILAQLREGVRKNGGENCIAIYEKHKKAREIRIYKSREKRKALPDEWVDKFWTTRD